MKFTYMLCTFLIYVLWLPPNVILKKFIDGMTIY